jgi:hypothetical protein
MLGVLEVCRPSDASTWAHDHHASSSVARAVVFVVYVVKRNIMNTEQLRTPTTNVNDDEKENPDEMETTNIRSENCQQQAAAAATAIPLTSSAAGAETW